jgi:hypothetical protein
VLSDALMSVDQLRIENVEVQATIVGGVVRHGGI